MSEHRADREAEAQRQHPGSSETSKAESVTPDPNDEIPVPVAMSPAEVDERAQVVETLRDREREQDAEEGTPPTEPSRRES